MAADQHCQHFRKAALQVCLCLLGTGLMASRSQAQPVEWKSGEAFATAARFGGLNGVWRGAALRDELTKASHAVELALIIDRRIDGDRVVTANLVNATFESLLWQVAGSCSAAVSELENCYYLGPPSTALAMPARMEAAVALARDRRLDAGSRRALQRKVTVRTRAEFIAGEYFQALASEHGLTLAGWEHIPFDLWAPVDLPEMTLVEAMTLGLAGFECHLVAGDDGQLRIARCEVQDRFVRTLDRDRIAPAMGRRLETIGNLVVARKSGQWLLTGDVAALTEASKLLAGLSETVDGPTFSPPAEVRLSLKTEARRLDILQAIAQQRGFVLELPASGPSQLAETVVVDADQVTLEQLIALVLDGSGLKGRIQDMRLEITER